MKSYQRVLVPAAMGLAVGLSVASLARLWWNATKSVAHRYSPERTWVIHLKSQTGDPLQNTRAYLAIRGTVETSLPVVYLSVETLSDTESRLTSRCGQIGDYPIDDVTVIVIADGHRPVGLSYGRMLETRTSEYTLEMSPVQETEPGTGP